MKVVNLKLMIGLETMDVKLKILIIIAIAFVLLVPVNVFAEGIPMYTISDTGIDIFTDKLHYEIGDVVKVGIRADPEKFDDVTTIGITFWDKHYAMRSEQFRVTPSETLYHEYTLDDSFSGEAKLLAITHDEDERKWWDEYFFFVGVPNPTDEDFTQQRNWDGHWSKQETNPEGYYIFGALSDPDVKSNVEIQAREEIQNPCTFPEPQPAPEYQGDMGLNDPAYMEAFRESQYQYDQEKQDCLREYQIQIEQRVAELEEPDAVCGVGTVEKNGQCVPDTKSSKGGGCLIATATYGSEMAPQVQQLRELRDISILQTESGTNFMSTFNDFYYSFSPIIADYERENPMFREMVKITITPMVSSLSILNYVDMDSEESVLGYGISLIILNGLMYVGIPVLAITRFRK